MNHYSPKVSKLQNHSAHYKNIISEEMNSFNNSDAIVDYENKRKRTLENLNLSDAELIIAENISVMTLQNEVVDDYIKGIIKTYNFLSNNGLNTDEKQTILSSIFEVVDKLIAKKNQGTENKLRINPISNSKYLLLNIFTRTQEISFKSILKKKKENFAEYFIHWDIYESRALEQQVEKFTNKTEIFKEINELQQKSLLLSEQLKKGIISIENWMNLNDENNKAIDDLHEKLNDNNF